MYATAQDPYLYKGSTVLKNRLGLKRPEALAAFEAEATAQRFDEPLPAGRFSPTHYRAIHKHIFGDVYSWAGRYRTVRMAKGASMFCYPEHIASEMRRVFATLAAQSFLAGLDQAEFCSGLAHVFSELNAIHPFRDGNGRTQLAFAAALANRNGRRMNFASLEEKRWLRAVIDSFYGDRTRLIREFSRLLRS